jgi:TatA/E family protein of Tat protein translocase
MGGLGVPEMLVILVVALVIFGPRKLPELGKTLGQSLAQFRKASEDFKRTWEDEVEVEKRRIDTHPAPAAETPAYGASILEPAAAAEAAASVTPEPAAAMPPPVGWASGDTNPIAAPIAGVVPHTPVTETKRDWM